MRYRERVEQTKTVRELRDSLGRSVDAAFYRGETTIVTKNGEPRAVLIPYEQYRHGVDAPQEAEVRRLRAERDAALNLAEGYAPEMVRRLRDQIEFERTGR